MKSHGDITKEPAELCPFGQWDIESEIAHDCGLDEGHEEAHKCHCGEEF